MIRVTIEIEGEDPDFEEIGRKCEDALYNAGLLIRPGTVYKVERITDRIIVACGGS